jgi:hypothetical protein
MFSLRPSPTDRASPSGEQGCSERQERKRARRPGQGARREAGQAGTGLEGRRRGIAVIRDTRAPASGSGDRRVALTPARPSEPATARSPWRAVPMGAVAREATASVPRRRGRPGQSGDLVPAARPRAARDRFAHLHLSGPAPSGARPATRPSPLATAGATSSGREAPAVTNPTRPARVAGRKEEI